MLAQTKDGQKGLRLSLWVPLTETALIAAIENACYTTKKVRSVATGELRDVPVTNSRSKVLLDALKRGFGCES